MVNEESSNQSASEEGPSKGYNKQQLAKIQNLSQEVVTDIFAGKCRDKVT